MCLPALSRPDIFGLDVVLLGGVTPCRADNASVKSDVEIEGIPRCEASPIFKELGLGCKGCRPMRIEVGGRHVEVGRGIGRAARVGVILSGMRSGEGCKDKAIDGAYEPGTAKVGRLVVDLE